MVARGLLVREPGAGTTDGLLGVDTTRVGRATFEALLPGPVNAPIFDPAPIRAGVAGVGFGVPSLVVGRLLFPNADAGREGGPMLWSGLKKPDVRLDFPAGEAGS